MVEYTIDNVTRTTRLRDAYGDDIVLSEDGEEGSSVHKIVLEFDIAGKSYAVLRAEGASLEDEISVFRVMAGADGEFEIETIEDDEEWENVSELVDEMTIAFPSES
jgi:uncharacterized protein YrzB (UPF0473 family)